uniref:ATPase AAA-type core domain-containing protein n=1 Tax=viral metagenome TaxID=1070528 RepID=A0A6C0H5Z2_9ZZZZ
MNYLSLYLSVVQLITSIIPLLLLVSLILNFMDIYWYEVSSNDKYNLILKNIKYSTKKDCNSKPLGYFIDWNYVGYIDNKYEIITILTFKNVFEKLIKNDNIQFNQINNDINKKENNEINLIKTSFSTFMGYNYSTRCINIKYINNDEQTQIIENIINIYNKNNTCVVYLYGKSGTGKSYLGFILTLKVKGKLKYEFDLLKHNNSFDVLYNCIRPSKNEPLIVMFDEIDSVFEKIKVGIETHKDYNPFIYDKQSWNVFMDNIKIIYPFTVFILTSNLSKNEIDEKYDESFIRKGRVDLYSELTIKMI